MTKPQGASAYLTTQVQSSTPVERVVLLYDAALRATLSARDAFARQDVSTRRDAISRALAIISELQSSLNMSEGGEIATSLDRLYTFVTERLMESTMRQDAKPLEHVRIVLQTLRDAWRTLATRPAASGSAA